MLSNIDPNIRRLQWNYYYLKKNLFVNVIIVVISNYQNVIVKMYLIITWYWAWFA